MRREHERARRPTELRATIPANDRVKIVRDWRIRAKELEMQNAELRRCVAEQAFLVREGKEHLAGILASAMDAIISVDHEQRIVLFNAAAERMFGWTAERIMGKPLRCLIPEHLRAAHDGHVRRFKKNKTIDRRRSVLLGLRADGTTFPIEAAISQFDVEGRTIFTAILRDVTHRLQAEESLRNSEQMLTDFFTAAPLGLMWVGADGRVVRVNQVELELLERPMDQVLGRPVGELHIDGAAVAELLDRVAKKQVVQNYHVSVWTERGGIKHLLVDANGLWDDGRLVHSRWFVRDITYRVTLECEILAIAERERARIGHDLHDDVCQQLVAIEYLNETLINEWQATAPAVALKAREISAQLRNAIDHARELARGLSPIQHFEPHGLMAALQELAQRTQRVFGRTCRFHGPAPVTINNATVNLHLYRIAQEAVTNAIKHSQASRIDIRLTTRDGAIILSVKDNGIGLETGPLERKGVGLRIMKYRVGAIGGSLEVKRTPKRGAAIVCTVKDAPNTRCSEVSR